MKESLKYYNTQIVFREIPNEITLAINISGCKIQCPDCHSDYLWKDVGEELNEHSLQRLINNNNGITCVCFMGGDHNEDIILSLCKYIKNNFNLKTAWYSGVDRDTTKSLLRYLDYIKIGPYIKERGGLDNPNTNQKLFEVIHSSITKIKNITNLLQNDSKTNKGTS